MITYVEGNMLNTPVQTIVNTVNTVGVMGKGIALSMKNRYPQMFEQYQEACLKKQLLVGKLMFYHGIDHDVLLFPTKVHWRFPSRIQWIEKGLQTFSEHYSEYFIDSIAFPMLGCGNGGLNWIDVKQIMESYLKELPITVLVYTGKGPVEIEQEKTYQTWIQDLPLSFSTDDVLMRISEYFMIPYEFQYNGNNFEMIYKIDSLTIQSSDIEFSISEESFVTHWNNWMKTGIIEEVQELTPLYYMLCAMNYMEPILYTKNEKQSKGYQMLLGRNRAFEKMRRN